MHKKVALIYAVLLICLSACLYMVFGRIEREESIPQSRGDPTMRISLQNRLIEIGNKTYTLHNDTTTILLMGIDRNEASVAQGQRMGGQTDFLRLVVIDKSNETVNQIQLDRDTMTPIAILGVLGDPAGVRDAQLCLAYGFGKDGVQSCKLTVDAVSELLHGVPIDLYLAMDMNGIGVLNDALGGVTVTLEEDFSELDAAMIAGRTLTLHGKQAEHYVRGRVHIGDGTNAARMRRQENYVSLLSEKLYSQMAADREFIGQLYDELSPHLTTNISRGRLINEVWAARDYQRMDLVKMKGEYAVGQDGFVEFYADTDALAQMVIDLFCKEME